MKRESNHGPTWGTKIYKYFVRKKVFTYRVLLLLEGLVGFGHVPPLGHVLHHLVYVEHGLSVLVIAQHLTVQCPTSACSPS